MKQETSEAVLELLLDEDMRDQAPHIPESAVAIGILTGFDELNRPLVALAGAASGTPLPARSILALDRSYVGIEVVLAFATADRRLPIVMGVLQEPSQARPQKPDSSSPGVTADLDGETVVLSAKREIELRCGRSSITLTRTGKILIRGAYLLSRSSGVNRIKGGSVQIN